MRVGVFSIFGLIILAVVYWAGTKNFLGGLISAVRGG